MHGRLVAALLLSLGGAATLGGCVYRERAVPAASPPATAIVAPSPTDRVVSYPEGRYELRGDGTATSPYYWVWIPAGSTPPAPQPPARRPDTR